MSSKRMGSWLIERIASRTAARSVAHSLMVELTNTLRRSTGRGITTKRPIHPEDRSLLQPQGSIQIVALPGSQRDLCISSSSF